VILTVGERARMLVIVTRNAAIIRLLN